MKKCIKCGLEIDDESLFCPHCGERQIQAQLKQFNASAFLRLFRPSFYGGLKRIGVTNDQLLSYMFYFLNLTKTLSDDEIKEINKSFYKCLNFTATEFLVPIDYNVETEGVYVLAKDNYDVFPDEEIRYNFVSDKIFQKLQEDFNKEISPQFIAIVWIFSLLSACDTNLNSEQKLFFKRLKMLFPVSREQFISSISKSYNLTIESGVNGYFPDLDNAISKFRNQISSRINFINSFISSFEIESFDFEEVRDIAYSTYRNTLMIYWNNDKDDVEVSLDSVLSDDFDFYQCVENKIKALCECEKQIQELEASEGKYSEIKEQITQLMDKEKTLLDTLTGFVYFNFYW